MIKIVYQISLKFYVLAIHFTALFQPKAKKWITGRKNWKQTLQANTKNWDNCIWFHCASLGEFEQGRPLIEKVKKQHPEKKILLSFFSPSGYENRKTYAIADYVCYLPIDSKNNAIDFISTIKCEMAIFIKYEWWYFYYQYLYKNEIPLYVVSSTFRKDQIFFKWHGSLHREMLSYCSHIFCQDENSKNLLQNKLNIKHCSVSGDTRYDTVQQALKTNNEISQLAIFKNKQQLIIGGSTYKQEDEILQSLINDSRFGDYKFIIVPHDIDKQYCQSLKDQLNAVLFTELNGATKLETVKVLIVDEIGHLLQLYAYANYALVGGGFGKGIHNILEASVYGIPVFTGPNWHKSIEAKELKDLACFFEIENKHQLADAIISFEDDWESIEKTKTTLQEFFDHKIGATDLIYEQLKIA